MKRIIALAVCMLIVFSLAGCGRSTESPEESSSPQSKGARTLIVYFSATGSTEKVAKVIAEETGGTLFELEPVDSYSSEDLDWTDDDSRVNLEHNDEALRSIALVNTSVQNWDDYDTVFIGYPIWWGIAAWPVNEFITSNDFSDKTVIPFCTSASSGIGESATLLSEMAGTGNWQDGYRFSSNASDSDITEWLSTLNY
jgi:flavodoxin